MLRAPRWGEGVLVNEAICESEVPNRLPDIAPLPPTNG
ncbi:hypothetical protein KNP414_03205 [Paenibacillus mucilaginosus KNP414]|nr:hypothetical protein KNP414_03205 [Paenibacillus mucilaginosus KNP414]